VRKIGRRRRSGLLYDTRLIKSRGVRRTWAMGCASVVGSASRIIDIVRAEVLHCVEEFP
jgi:hypothetical protein